jgi:hypothetical protein
VSEERRLLSMFQTLPHDLSAFSTFKNAIAVARSACDETLSEEDRRHGEVYVHSLERCYGHLESMLRAGVTPMIEDPDQVLSAMSKQLGEREAQIVDLLSEVGLLRSRLQDASLKLYGVARKLNEVHGVCEAAWMLGKVVGLLERGS